MERNLAGAADLADYVVDLSNVVRNTSLGLPGARSLRRLDRVLRALVAATGDPGVTAYLVADRSLLGGAREFPDPQEVRRLRRWVAEGLVEEVDEADERVLEIAGMTGTRVVSGDRFEAHRQEHPWVQGNTWQFLRPERTAGRTPEGGVRLVPVDMGYRSEAEISRMVELSALKKQGLLGLGRTPIAEVLDRSWACPERRCSLYEGRGGHVLLPRMRSGVPTCELHGLPLRDSGRRAGTAQLKVVLDGVCVGRYTLDEGTETHLGRSPGPGGIVVHPALAADRAGRISRRHLSVAVRDGVLTVRDASTYGSRIRRSGRHGVAGEWRALDRAAGTGFRPGDEVELAPGVVVTRSGRHFPAELSRAWRADPRRTTPPGHEGATTFLQVRRDDQP
ncbi:FHA domain-containing protein [Kitasatospora sp. NPDC004240]